MAVLNRVSLPEVPPAPSFSSSESGFSPPPPLCSSASPNIHVTNTGPVTYEVAVYNSSDVLMDYREVDPDDLILSGLVLQEGERYYAELRITNLAGLSAHLRSSGVLIDRSSPAPFTVLDGNRPSGDADAQTSASELYVRWQWRDAPLDVNGTLLPWGGGPAVAYWEVAVMTTPCVTGFVVPFEVFADDGPANGTDAALVRRFTGLALDAQATYFGCVRAWTATGLMTEMASDGITVDHTPPRRGVLQVPRPVPGACLLARGTL